MADMAGGRTQMAGIVSAVGVLAVVLLLADELRYVPVAALAAILVYASFAMFDIAWLRGMWRIDRSEVALAIITTLGVVAVGAIDAILIAVGLALVRFVRVTARPRDEVLGKVDRMPGLHAVDRHAGARTWPGLLIYRFDGPLTFFNAGYFGQRLRSAVRAAGADLEWVVLDMIPISHLDISGATALRDLRLELEEDGVRLMLAGRRTEIVNWLKDVGQYDAALHEGMLFSTLRAAVKEYRRHLRVKGSATP
jgi:MFS superfamily sulfate permease-like transporter